LVYQGQKQKQKRTLRHLPLTSVLRKVEKIKETPVIAPEFFFIKKYYFLLNSFLSMNARYG
jgi:hypothetical protein